jgi:hypothetical protein
MTPTPLAVTAAALLTVAPAQASDPTAPIGTAGGSLWHPNNITPEAAAELEKLAAEKVRLFETDTYGKPQRDWFDKVREVANRHGLGLRTAMAMVAEAAASIASGSMSILGSVLGSYDWQTVLDHLEGRTDADPKEMTNTSPDRSGAEWGDLPGWLSDSGSESGVMDDSYGENADESDEDPDDNTSRGGNSASQSGAGDYGTDDLRNDDAGGYAWNPEDEGSDEDNHGDYDPPDDEPTDEHGTGDGWLVSMTADGDVGMFWDISDNLGNQGCLAEVFYTDSQGAARWGTAWSDSDCATALGLPE